MKALGRSESPPRLGLAAFVVIYALESIGSFILAHSLLRTGSPSLGTSAIVYACLLAVIPLTFLTMFLINIRKVIVDVRIRGYGSRLRAKLVRLFLLVALLSSLPHGLFLGALLRSSIASPWSERTRAALDAGFRLAVSYQEERISRLAYLTERDALALGERVRWDPDSLLAALQEHDQGVASVEIFLYGVSIGFAGAEGIRLNDVSAASPGALSRIGVGEVTYLRHLARAPTGGISVAVSLRLPHEIDETADTLGRVRRLTAAPGFVSGHFGLFFAFFWVIFALPPLLITLLVGISAADSIASPVAALEEAARAAATGDLSPRLLPRPGDELGGLVAAWNHMLSGVEASRYEAAAAEKVAAWRDIAQRLAHELKNPLTPIRLSAERVLRRYKSDPSSVGEILESSMLAIIQETEAMNALLTDFRSFARLPEPQADWTNLRSLVEAASSPYAASFPDARFDLAAVDPEVILRIDRVRMRQALANIISNALDAMEGKGTVSFRSDLVKAAESRYCRLQIRDTGRGIPPEIRDRVFVPYFTTKSEGTGLGLAITERIVQDHGGRVRFESEPGSGTVFYVDLPIDA
jgi:two-component system, NtrC family, nitrogen regulation sensor histidine kinase NtrY